MSGTAARKLVVRLFTNGTHSSNHPLSSRKFSNHGILWSIRRDRPQQRLDLHLQRHQEKAASPQQPTHPLWSRH